MVQGVSFESGVKKFIYGNYRLLWEAHFHFSTLYALYRFINLYRNARNGLLKTQILYVIIANITIFFTAGVTNVALLWFGIYDYVWLGPPLTLIWFYIVCYTILKYNLMDIKVAGARVIIFLFVYSFVLGIPFGLKIWGQEWLNKSLGAFGSWVPMLSLLCFATSGPFLYLYFQRKVEEKLLEEETRRHHLLKQTAVGMNTVHELEKLGKVLINVIKGTFHIKKAAIYIIDRERGVYERRYPAAGESDVAQVAEGDVLIDFLCVDKERVIVAEEIEHADIGEHRKEIVQRFKSLGAGVVIPVAYDKDLTGFIVMESLRTGRPYSKGDLEVFGILGSNVGLAVAGCQAWDAHERLLDEKGTLERMTSLDLMAGSIAHEINNPVQAISMEAGFIKGLLQEIRAVLKEEDYEDMASAQNTIERMAERIDGMVKTILRFSEKRGTELREESLSDVVEDFETLMGPHLRQERVRYEKSMEEGLPRVAVNRVLMVAALMNFARNSLHAMHTNKEKRIRLRVSCANGKWVRVEFEDNGCGIEKHKLEAVFAAFQTSKGSSEGTGLGLYRARRDIVDHFKGKIHAESEGKGRGVTIVCELPVQEQGSVEKGRETNGG
jgi:signal transduction histidine kinase